jgi:eukaryotic-like serine/threonine-protein kinase
VTEPLEGYRILRRLGEGPRAEVLLAHADDGESIVLKRYRPDVPVPDILRELAAIERAAGPHVVPLLDVAVEADGTPVAVLARFGGGSLGRLLLERSTFSPGEAVTLLAPLAIALARLHDAGVLHGGIRPDAVLFDDAGTPTIAGFGRARIVAAGMAPADRESEPGFADDRAALLGIAAAVLERVPGAEALPLDDDPAALADRLFDWAEPAPVRLAADVPEAVVPARMLRAAPVETPSQAAMAVGIPDWIAERLPADLFDAARARLAAARASLGAVRLPVWFVAGAAALGLLAAVILVPGAGGTDAAEPGPTPTSTPVATAPATAGPVGGDDPVAAAVALLQTRERCMRDLSVLCLDAVGQAGSGALADDQAAVLAMQEGGESPALPRVDPTAMSLVERLGDTAIVALGSETEPASLLLMRSEAGWRIREYLTG